MKLLIINGPNINMLGVREPEIYGRGTYDDLVSYIREERELGSKKLPHDAGAELIFVQSNHEGDLIDAIQSAYYNSYDGIIINAGGYTHTSIAILDALKAVNIPTVEVHISEPLLREDYRHHSYIGEIAIASIAGKGFSGYVDAIDILIKHIESHMNE